MHAELRIGDDTLMVSDGYCAGAATFAGFGVSLPARRRGAGAALLRCAGRWRRGAHAARPDLLEPGLRHGAGPLRRAVDGRRRRRRARDGHRFDPTLDLVLERSIDAAARPALGLLDAAGADGAVVLPGALADDRHRSRPAPRRAFPRHHPRPGRRGDAQRRLLPRGRARTPPGLDRRAVRRLPPARASPS